MCVYSIMDDLKLVGKFDDVLESPLTSLPVFDISSRLLCYTSSSLSDSDAFEDETDIPFKMDEMEPVGGVGKMAKSFATKAAKGVGVVGGYGYNAIQNYLSGEKDATGPDTANDPRYGAVTLVLLSRHAKPSVICKFKPHKHPISTMCINNAGTMLLTASTLGKSVCAWSLMNCFTKPKPHVPVCLTRFIRGLTSATVTNLSISNDDQWLTVATSTGTVHLYQITGESSNLACLKLNSRNVIQMARSMFPTTGSSLSPRNTKISSSIENEASDLGYDDVYVDALQNVPMGFILPSTILDKNSPTEKRRSNGSFDKLLLPVLCWNPFGKLSLSMVRMTEANIITETGPKTKTTFSMANSIEWNVCRMSHWEERFCSLSLGPGQQKENLEQMWPSLIEIATSNTRVSPIWSDPQIELQLYRLKNGIIIGTDAVQIPPIPKRNG